MASEAAGTEVDKRGHGRSSEQCSVQEPNPIGPCPGLLCFSLQRLRTELRTPKSTSRKPSNHSTVTHSPRANLTLMTPTILFTLFARCEQVTQLLMSSLASLSRAQSSQGSQAVSSQPSSARPWCAGCLFHGSRQ